jgi:hypothetical protein
MLKSVLLALPLGLTAMAAAASDLTQRDAACVHVATVQYLDCEVAVLYSCPAAKGYASPLVREEAYGENGFDHYEVDTANGGLVVTGDAAGSFVIRSDPKTLVETTLAEVIKTGRGNFEAKGSFTYLGVKKPAGQNISVKATGETMTLGGISMTTFMADVAIDLPKPMGPTTSISKAYLVPSLGLYLSGEEMSGTFFKPDTVPHRPIAIAVPGQPGFDTIKPGTCGGSLSLLETPLTGLNALEGVPS